MAKVRVQHSGQVVFQGPNKEAEEYLARNFPWNHVNAPGNEYLDKDPEPDAVVEYDEVKDEEE